MEVLLWLLGLYLLVAPVVGIAAYVSQQKSRNEIRALRNRLTAATDRLEELTETVAALHAELGLEPEPEATPSAAEAPEAAPDAARAAFERSLLGAAPRAEPAAAEPPATEPPAAEPPAAEPPAAGGLEQSLTSRWLVWLGAVTIALGSIFLVKYSIEQGWLGPAIRVALGFMFGVCLAVAGEWLRQRPLQRALAAIGPNYLPPALTSAGLFSAFASVYAAFQLYGLIGPLAAFAIMAALALAGVGLSILHGPMVALLGLLGGFATPWLVPAEQPLAWGLFAYLLFLVGTALAVVRYLAWWWLAWAALAGAVLWALFWFAGFWVPADAPPLGLYLLVLCGLFLLVRHGRGASVELVNWRTGPLDLDVPERVAWAAALAVAGLVFIFVRLDGYDVASWVVLVAFVILCLGVGYREAVFDTLVGVAAALVLAVMAVWHLPEIIDAGAPLYSIGGRDYGTVPGPIVPPELGPFVTVSLVSGALFGLAGFAALWRVRRPALWATVSAVVPLALLAVAYWRVTAFEVDLGWSAAALALAGAYLAAAAHVRRRDSQERLILPLGAYASAVVTGTGFAATMALEQAWLTVALALQLPALAWIHDRLGLWHLRVLAALIAGLVLLRLVFNLYILDYPLGDLPGFNWVLYGYGLPALAFFIAARVFRRSADDRLVLMLEWGSLIFAALLVTFEIRTLVEGRLDSPDYGLLEQSLNTVAWLCMAYLVRIYARLKPRPVLVFGWRILAGLAAAQVVLLQLLLANPLWSREMVGELPLVNLLFLAYALPALFAFHFARALAEEGHGRSALGAGVLGLVLVWSYLSLEVRRAFHGAILGPGAMSDAELYAYSALWLGYALVLLALAILRGITSLRHASLVLLLVTVAKVFLVDMAALAGLYRVASFLGLGLILVGIGYLYQRFVFAGPKEAPEAAAGEAPTR